jgi:hypothetical protein
MDNPYRAPETEVAPSDELRRPLGVSILAVLAVLYIFFMLAAVMTVFTLPDIQVRLVDLVVGTTVRLGLLIAAAVGMWRGRKWAWWIMCVALVKFVMSNLKSIAIILPLGVLRLQSVVLTPQGVGYLVGASLSLATLVYWQSQRVRIYFRIVDGRFKTIAISVLCSMGISAVLALVREVAYSLSN